MANSFSICVHVRLTFKRVHLDADNTTSQISADDTATTRKLKSSLTSAHKISRDYKVIIGMDEMILQVPRALVPLEKLEGRMHCMVRVAYEVSDTSKLVLIKNVQFIRYCPPAPFYSCLTHVVKTPKLVGVLDAVRRGGGQVPRADFCISDSKVGFHRAAREQLGPLVNLI
ncbi:hypothetical protein BDW74DRAFT_116120 [Aspergillus multicolor]|uniref:uncharacterized protein n=1 Tax=Aspergillus multicolor TaxID=41759 RepID=UPI003CCCCBD4